MPRGPRTVGAGRRDPRQAGLKASTSSAVDAQAPVEFLTSIEYNVSIATEWTSEGVAASQNQQIPIEHSQTLQIFEQANIENLTTLKPSIQSPVEYSSTILSNKQIPSEWMSVVLINKTIPIEWIVALSQNQQIPTEWTLAGISVSQNQTIPIEWIIDISNSQQIPSEWTGAVSVAQNQQIPIEWISEFSQNSQIFAEWISEFSQNQQIAIESLIKKDSFLRIPIEFLKISDFKYIIPIENLTGQSITEQIPTEWTSTVIVVNSFANMPIEWQRGWGIGIKIPASSLKIISSNPNLLVEFIKNNLSTVKLSVDYNTEISTMLKIDISHLFKLSANNQLFVEWSGTVFIMILIDKPLIQVLNMKDPTIVGGTGEQ